MFAFRKSARGVLAGAAIVGCLLPQGVNRAFLNAEASPLDPAVAELAGKDQTEIQSAVESVSAFEIAKLSAKRSPEFASPKFALAQRRLLSGVPDEIERYFDLFMYVSKATSGPLAQRMFVFKRGQRGRLVPYADWQVSTGREQIEWVGDREVDTSTPEGVFMLDPGRFHREYWSKTWDDSPMHYAMFYDLKTDGYRTGLAIHAAVGEEKVDRLGRRDSGGCIRLAPDHARQLFYKVRDSTQGRIPVLAANGRGSTNLSGKAKRNKAGKLILRAGYRALLFVEDYDGADDVVGSISEVGSE